MLPTARILLIVCSALAAASPSRAQDIPIPSFIDRGLDGLFGGEDSSNGEGGSGNPGAPTGGAYASPSARELVPDGADVGVPSARALQRFSPIALPQRPGLAAIPDIDLPALPAYAPQNLPDMEMIQSRKALVLEAKLTEDGETIPSGLVWRLFSPIPGPDGKLPLIASAEGGTASFEIPPGAYYLHVGFGRGGVTKRIDFTGVQTRDVVVLGAGGLSLDAVASNDTPIADDAVTFDIYSDAEDERDRDLLASNVPAGEIVRLNAGTYHVVSKYGSINAVVRADVRVEPGQITEATLQHRAAQLTMKLVRESGGEAIADTAWSISTASGDVIRESVGAFPSMVLAEGDYLIVAKNKDRIYQRHFEVQPGVNTDVEVLTSDLIASAKAGRVVPATTAEGSGD